MKWIYQVAELWMEFEEGIYVGRSNESVQFPLLLNP